MKKYFIIIIAFLFMLSVSIPDKWVEAAIGAIRGSFIEFEHNAEKIYIDGEICFSDDVNGDVALSDLGGGTGDSLTDLQGYIRGVKVIYNDANTVTITTGEGECNGNWFVIDANIDFDLTAGTMPATDFSYIYIDDSESVYPTPTFISSNTEPAYSTSLHGWYNGNDRCIFVVYCTALNTIDQFLNPDGQTLVWYTGLQILSNGNPNGAWQTQEATAYTPVQSIGAFVYAYNSDSDSSSAIAVTTTEFTSGYCEKLEGSAYQNFSVGFGWLSLYPGISSRDFYWFGYNDDDNAFDIWICGYRIER